MTEVDSDLVRIAEDDPTACIRICETMIADGVADALAYRALGLARRSLGEVSESIEALSRSRQLFEDGGEVDEAAESIISLAASVAMKGDVEGAVSMLDGIDSRDPLITAHARVQKAGIVARRGDFATALSLYELAEPILIEASDQRWLALMHSTRGLIQTFRGEYARAEEDLVVARNLFLGLRREARAAELIHNLGFVAVQRGDIARGLSLLLEAETQLQRIGEPTEATLVDRARAYMYAGLPGPAYQSAMRAADQLSAQGRELELTEALQQAAEAALAGRDLYKAIDAAQRAALLAAAQDRPGWHAQARLVTDEAAWRMGNPSEPQVLSTLADELLATHNRSGAAQALAIAALIEIDRGSVESAAGLIDHARPGETTIGIQSSLLLSLATARTSLARGDTSGARAILESASDRVAESRATLAATEARAGISRLAEEIADLGIEVLHDAAESIVDWSEKFRAASLRIAPVVAEHGSEREEVLASLRSTLQDVEAMRREGEDPSELVATAREMEARIRDLVMTQPGPGTAATGHTRAEIEDALGGSLMMYLYETGEELHAEMLGADDGSRGLGSLERARSLAEHLGAALRRSFLYPTADMATRTAATLNQLGDFLFGHLSGANGDVVVVPPPGLAALPWNALAKTTAPEISVVVAPSAGSWVEARTRPRPSGGMVVVAGPRLDHAASEAEAVANMQPHPAVILDGQDATVGAVLSAMRAADQLHLVAHTRLRDDNPMFSALELSDGFLSLYDLEGAHAVPSRVMLSACDSGHENVIGGYDMFGLTTVLLAAGASSILATVAPIPDGDSSIVAVRRIYQHLIGGETSGTSLREAIRLPDNQFVDPSIAFVAYGS